MSTAILLFLVGNWLVGLLNVHVGPKMKIFAGFVPFIIFPVHEAVFLVIFKIYWKQKKLRNLNLTCQGVFGGSVFPMFSAWQCSSAQFSKNWWVLGSCHRWKTNTLFFPQRSQQHKENIQPMHPYSDMNKASKKESLCPFMGAIKRVLSFLCSPGNGQRPPNSFHKGCYKSSSQ